MRTAYFELQNGGGAHYTDHGPNPYKNGNTPTARESSLWANRPFCDLCGPWRGRYLRSIGHGEYRCRGCDNE